MISQKDIIRFVFQEMSSKEIAKKYLCQFDIAIQESFSYKKIADIAIRKKSKIKLDELFSFFKKSYQPHPVEYHLKNLRSGMLRGHSWHKTAPSRLHLSLQTKVREHIADERALPSLIQIGSDIMKHEYFMVATHDLIESMLVDKFDFVIPSHRKKGVSDFIFNKIPFDLKNTSYPTGLKNKNATNKELADNLISKADTDRIRKQAKRSYKGMGLNRFFVVMENQEDWLNNPDQSLKKLEKRIRVLKAPIKMNIDGISFYCQVVRI